MYKTRKIQLNKIKTIVNQLLRKMAEHSFINFVALFIISLVIGIFIFIKFVYLFELPTGDIAAEQSLKIEIKTYQKIKEEWDRRNRVLSEVEPKQYPNPFPH